MKINLITPPPRLVRISFVAFWSMVGALSLLILDLLFQDDVTWNATKDQALLLQNAQARLSAAQAKLTHVAQTQASSAMQAQINTLLTQAGRPAEAVRELRHDVPFGGTVVNLNYAGSAITAVINVRNYQAAAVLVKTLDADALFANVTISSVGQGTGTTGNIANLLVSGFNATPGQAPVSPSGGVMVSLALMVR